MATGRIGVTPTLGTRWSKAPSAGTTSLSGLDDSSVSLVYSVGYEQVYRNGVLLSRGNDYTATSGNSITLTDATVNGDIIEVFANELVPLTDAISKGQFTAKGSLLSASAASTPAVLAVGSNDQVLTADSSTSTGLKWAAASSGAMTFITKNTFSNVASVTIDNIFSSSYDNYEVYMEVSGATSGDDIILQMVYSGTRETGAVYYGALFKVYTTTGIKATQGSTEFPFLESTAGAGGFVRLTFQNVGNSSEKAQWHGTAVTNNDIANLIGGYCSQDRTYTGIYLYSSSSNITGFVTVYGLAKS